MPAAQETYASSPWRLERFKENPIITPYLMGNAEENINNPSLVRVPDWVKNKLGRYYLYFSHHEGAHLRLAYADELRGPWKIHAPGVLSCASLPWLPDHIASPDVLIDGDGKKFFLYFHTPTAPMIKSDHPDYYKLGLAVPQRTFLALSDDGLNFALDSDKELAQFYLRVWRRKGHWYGLARAAVPLYRSSDGRSFEETPGPFSADPEEFRHIRHVAVMHDDDMLTVFYTRLYDAPERIFMVRLTMTDNWEDWKIRERPRLVLAPETGYEGAHLPLVPSRLGSTRGFENALRDPCIFRENGRLYLLYCVVGERGIAIAELL
ncbi:MAG: hypothetical protein LBH94_03110 [Deltaproteobacteria bacterium]|jgi:hypothetical protein|nr:hypothetical protein [Deltaproteobacteria bacterium]